MSLISLLIREMQIKTMSYHLTAMAIVIKARNKYWEGHEEKATTDGRKIAAVTMENNMELPQNIKTTI